MFSFLKTYFYKFIFYFQTLKNWKKGILFFFLIFGIWYYFSLPKNLFSVPYSTVLVDKKEQLLGATISKDGQWRFPLQDTVPQKFAQSLMVFEDQYFRWHWGFNPISFVRALYYNVKEGKVVSGGSTITMQVIRLAQQKERTIWQKLIEIVLSTRLEFSYSKDEILSLYAAHAPFGGNVVGLEAAAWRYYGRKASQLSWAEAATLAVLPNAPSLIFPGKNQEKLLAKRNRLLDKLFENELIDSLTWQLSKLEDLPQKPLPLPSHASHLLFRAAKEGFEGKIVKSSIDLTLQQRLNAILDRHHQHLAGNEIHNAAILLADIKTGKTLAYLGNTFHPQNLHQNEVDIITAPRSTGSLLKPFLFASMQMEGILLPQTLVADVPIHFSGYMPKNFDKKYDGAVAAQNALARSLNIPMVLMLQEYGIAKFQEKLQKLGITTIKKPADHYGLSLILGGAEANLWEMSGAYASMARTLNHFMPYNGKYMANDYHSLTYLENKDFTSSQETHYPPLDAASIWLTFQSLKGANRPREELGWERFASGKPIAWKTGTSFGFRDAWSIGVTPNYVIGVWVGNADGEGRPNLTGLNCAAPILFDVFRILDGDNWFTAPYDELMQIPTCHWSGHRASPYCQPIDSVWVHQKGLDTSPCPYHQEIHLDKTGTKRVNSLCASPSEMQKVSWFILPPVQEWYYKSHHIHYKILPPIAQGCEGENIKNLDVLYPRENAKILIPKQLDGQIGRSIFEAVHRKKEAEIHWHLDEEYLGKTIHQHQMSIYASEGFHELILIDQWGEKLHRKFEVVKKE
jgi:penicillin-binding protein 1C